MSNWVDTETEKTTINDKRLNIRLKKRLNAVSQQPTESLPAVTNGWSETLAAYRFLNNEKVCFDTILAGHREATIERIRQQPVVLILQDTTFLNYGQAEKVGYGTLRKTKSEHYLLHPSVAFTPSRVNLGVLGAKFWQGRRRGQFSHCCTEKRSIKQECPIAPDATTRELTPFLSIGRDRLSF